jgi:two-component system, NarL family, sensor histidine kinase DesK
MKWFKLPTGADKPSWASLWGAVSMAYIFVEPYQRQASWVEWTWTGLAFLIFLALFIVAAIDWSRKHVMQRVCIAMAVLAITFTIYRSSGVFFFIFVAAFGPLAVNGSIVGSAAIIVSSVSLIFSVWWLLWPPSLIPYVVSLEAFLVGGGITFVVRQQIAVRRIVKSAERERIARDLHDILGHTLSVVILKSELASRLIERDPQRAKTEIDEVERISRQALHEVRQAIHGYHDGDIQSEFERAQATLETIGIVVESHFDAVDIPATQERVLALVLREAVTNVVRHAQAKHCRISLQKMEDAYRMTIRDDGRGVTGGEGIGMRGIRERVMAIGGTASWITDHGTELTTTVPINVNADS